MLLSRSIYMTRTTSWSSLRAMRSASGTSTTTRRRLQSLSLLWNYVKTLSQATSKSNESTSIRIASATNCTCSSLAKIASISTLVDLNLRWRRSLRTLESLSPLLPLTETPLCWWLALSLVKCSPTGLRMESSRACHSRPVNLTLPSLK